MTHCCRFSAAFFVNVGTVGVLIIQYVFCFVLDASSDICMIKLVSLDESLFSVYVGSNALVKG